jgi:hypothetical protein
MNADVRGYELAAENDCRPSVRQKTPLQRFLSQPDGLHGLRPCAAVAAQFSSSQLVPISVH